MNLLVENKNKNQPVPIIIDTDIGDDVDDTWAIAFLLSLKHYANIILSTINGLVTLSSRPSDAIAIALRSNIPVTVNEEVFETNSIDLIIDSSNEIEEFKQFINDIKPEDFS